jgi:rfaE bifunctional protein kinase chain/domain
VQEENKHLLDSVGNFQGKKIAVWGDIIYDEYILGATRRISREAPVLILSYRSKEFSLGGAGNSILNLKALQAEPVPIGVLGKDESGEEVLQILKTLGISKDHVLIEKDFQTPLKTRILAGEETARKQQILRIDREAQVPDKNDIVKQLTDILLSIIPSVDALLISDYNYDTVKQEAFNAVIPEYKRAGIPVSLDSRFQVLQYKDITIATPNEPELEEAIQVELDKDEDIVEKAGSSLLERIRARAVLVTRGAKGMVLFEKGKTPYSIPAHGASDIVDVTGAGDTVISVLTLALASGSDFREAAKLANYAASVVVMKKGTATVSIQELKEAIVS